MRIKELVVLTALITAIELFTLFKTVQRKLVEEDSLWTFSTLNLVRDGGIRWNSIYLILLRYSELREPISRFIRKLQRGEADDGDAYNPLIDELSDEDWDTVDQLKNFLERFHRATLKLEGKTSTSAYGALWQTILQLQLLDNHLRDALEAADAPDIDGQPSYIKSAASYGLERLTTYWGKLILGVDISYPCVALALNPQRSQWVDLRAPSYGWVPIQDPGIYPGI